MRQKKIVAAVVLAASLALPAATRELRGDVTAMSQGQWQYALGMSRREALMFGLASLAVCGAIPNPGALACGAAGAL
ncbi:MAG: hypothetical protein M3Q55_10810 [Acidobacteriota bacterium]|nr:hypothetical protein [Acidobacteriota bacterium]